MKKKLLSIVLTVAMLATLFANILVPSATDAGTLTVGTTTITQGTTEAVVDITVDLPADVYGPHELLILTIPDGFTLSAVELADVVYTQGGEPVPEDPSTNPDVNTGKITIGDPTDGTNGTNLETGAILLESSSVNVDDNCPVVDSFVIKATYTVPADVAVGTYGITVDNQLVDATPADIALTVADGAIVVAEPHVCVMQTKYDETGHWTECECGEKTDVVTHTLGEYVANEDGTTETATCTEDCGYTHTQDIVVDECDHANATKVFKDKTDTEFVYTYTCSDCGETWDGNITIGEAYTGYTGDIKRVISPTNDISMSFRFQNTGISDYTDFIAHIAKEEYAVNATEPTIDNSYITTLDTTTLSGYYAYKFNDIAAYEMSVNITCSLYGYDAVNNQMVKLASTTYSVQQYVMDALASYASTTNVKLVQLRTALVDLLNYGSAVQTLRRTNTANLANSQLTEVQKAYGTPEEDYCNDETVWTELPEIAGVLDGADDTNKITDVSRTLITAEKVKMQFTFTEFAGDIENYYAKFDYNIVNGNPTSITYSYADIGFTNTNGKSGFLFGDALIPTLDYPVKVTFYYGDPDNGGTAVFETVFSIEAYCANYYNFSNASVANVCKTIYAYGQSMATFVGTPAYTA